MNGDQSCSSVFQSRAHLDTYELAIERARQFALVLMAEQEDARAKKLLLASSALSPTDDADPSDATDVPAPSFADDTYAKSFKLAQEACEHMCHALAADRVRYRWLSPAATASSSTASVDMLNEVVIAFRTFFCIC